MCMHKKQKNKYNVKYICIYIYVYVKYILKKKKIENFHDGNILTIFLIFWPFSSWTFL